VVVDGASFVGVKEVESLLDLLLLFFGEIGTTVALGHGSGVEAGFVRSEEVWLFEHFKFKL